MRKCFLLRTQSRLFMFVMFMYEILAALSCIGISAPAWADDSLLPDMAFQIDCSQNSRRDFDDQVARYFTDQGFRVVDVAKSRADQGGDPGRHELLGVDRRDRIVKVVSFPRRPNHLSFSLVSMPPTRQDPGFESAVENFFTRELICEVSQITTHENGVDGVASFKAELDRLDALLQSAEGLDPSASRH